MNVHMTNDYAADQLLWPNVVRAVGHALAFAPLSAVATAGIEPENAGSASDLFNMMCNLGGAVGIAVLQTLPKARGRLQQEWTKHGSFRKDLRSTRRLESACECSTKCPSTARTGP